MILPKILILNQPFVNNTGGGITMSNLFADWDKDKLAVTCSGYLLTKEIDPEICNNYYQLGTEERKWRFPFNLFGRKYESGPIKFSDASKDKVVDESSKSKSRISFITKYLNPFLNTTGLVHFNSKMVLSSKFKKWLDDYNPDVIYAQCSSRERILFCIEVQKYLKKPFVFHMMDDWPSLIGVDGFMKNFWQRKIDREFKKLLDVTDIHLGICDYMGEAYLQRYGKQFRTFHNPIDLEFWQQGQKQSYELDNSPTILYAGRIGLGIDEALKSIADAVDQINADLKINMKFLIQAQSAPLWIKSYNCVEYKPFVPYEQLPFQFGAVDFLILPYDFSPASLAYIKYSMPTKASEYMASGAPIIIYAPKDTALVQYANQYQWASIVTNPDTSKLTDALRELIQNQTLREQLALKAKALAKNRHDKTVVTKNFQRIITEAANQDMQMVRLKNSGDKHRN